MSSNNLLLSLLTNSSSSSRSSSLMFKNTSTNPYSNLRSNSISHVEIKKQKEIKDHMNQRLIRFGHFLNLKVKNIYFFSFCKLQQLYKKHKSSNKQIKQQNLKVAQEHKPAIEPVVSSIKRRKQEISIRITGLIDTIGTIMSKRKLLQKDQISYAFQSLVLANQRRKALQRVPKCLKNQIINRKRQVFGLFCKIEKDRMRAQIFSCSLTTIFQNHMKISFYLIKNCQRSLQILQIPSYTTIEQQQNQDSSRCILTDRTEQEYLNSSQKIVKTKKIILRQRRPNISQPLSINIKDKLKQIPMKFDNPVSHSWTQNDAKMSSNLNIKSDNILKCLPDLNDNCNLFGQIQPPCFTLSSISSQENNITQSKEYLDLYQMSACLSERNNNQYGRGRSNSIKNTPKYVKDSSQTNLLAVNKKEALIDNNSQSPLTKIDEIIEKIEQMNSYKSKEKSAQKKMMLNVNISKEIHQYSSNSSAIKYRKKTPTYRYEQTQKQNIRERLVTQRQKPRKIKPSGLDSIPKNKSTILTKGKQPQLSTARKMKMQIQNIINRRNKQLFYRAESVQLN